MGAAIIVRNPLRGFSSTMQPSLPKSNHPKNTMPLLPSVRESKCSHHPCYQNSYRQTERQKKENHFGDVLQSRRASRSPEAQGKRPLGPNQTRESKDKKTDGSTKTSTGASAARLTRRSAVAVKAARIHPRRSRSHHRLPWPRRSHHGEGSGGPCDP